MSFANNRSTKVRIKAPVQARSKETRKKIIETSRELFSEHGFDTITTTQIAHRAGVSIGSIYAHFEDKWSIFFTILERYLEEIFDYLKDSIDNLIEEKKGIMDTSITDTRISNSRVPEVVDSLIFGLYAAHRLNGKLNLEIKKFTLMDERAREIHSRWEEREEKEVVRLLEYFKDEIKVRDINAAVTIIHRSAHEMFQYLFQNRDSVDEKAILSDFCEMIKSFIIK